MKEKDEIERLKKKLKELEHYKSIEQGIYSTLFNRIADCVAIYKVVDNGDDFIFIDFNPAAEKSENVKKEDLLGKKVTEMFPAIKEFGLLDVFREVHKTQKPAHFPITFYKDSRISGWRDNNIYPIDENHIVAVYQDITREKQYEEKLQLSAKVFESAQEAIIITDSDSRILQVNEAYVTLSGFSREEVIGHKAKFMKSDLHPPEFYTEMWKNITKNGHWEGEIWDRNKNGRLLILYLMISAKKNEKGEVTHYIGIYLDITEQKKTQDYIHKLAYYDVLTNLGNRTLFQIELERLLNLSKRSKYSMGLLFLDLDNFKYINDTYGHKVGDLLLIEAGNRIKVRSRNTDFTARLGGDEFTIIVTNFDNPDNIGKLAFEIIQTLSEPYLIEGKKIHTTVSVGISVYPQDGESPDILLRNADTAMYSAKRSGRNKYAFFTPAMNQAVRTRLEYEAELRIALEKNQLELYYQPIISLDTGRLHCLEALLRWNHPEKGIVMPDVFIPIAEESDLILSIGKWVFEQACRYQKYLKEVKKLVHPPKVSVNVSNIQLQNSNFCNDIIEILEYIHCDHNCIDIEITESILMTNIETSIKKLNFLKEKGLSISIDDFGTGYSSMSYLQKLPIDTLKIDKTFIADTPGDNDATKIVNAIVALSKSLSIKTVAEGVELKKQEEFLRSIECNYAQGYLYSPPVAPAKLQFESAEMAG